jgi:hypothetical protein
VVIKDFSTKQHQAETIQWLLDGELTLGEIASTLGLKHRQTVHKIIQKYNLEKYKAFDEDIIENEAMNFEWLWEMDKLDEMKREVIVNDRYYLPEVMDEEWSKVDRFVRDNYDSLINFFETSNDEIYLDHIFRKCVKCEYKPLSDFSKKEGYWGLESECRECRNSRLRTWASENYSITKYRTKSWRMENRERNSVIAQRRRAALEGLPHDCDYENIIDVFGEECAFTNATSPSLEHFIPVSWRHGGTHVGNVYFMSKSLNSSKHNRNPFEWFDYAEKEFGLDRSKFNELVAKLAELNGLTTEQFRSFVYWCDANRRTPEEAAADRRPSVEIWKEAIGWTE